MSSRKPGVLFQHPGGPRSAPVKGSCLPTSCLHQPDKESVAVPPAWTLRTTLLSCWARVRGRVGGSGRPVCAAGEDGLLPPLAPQMPPGVTGKGPSTSPCSSRLFGEKLFSI